MDHRGTDSSDISVKVERKVPITWVLGGLGGIAIMFGSWMWNVSIALNNVGRDVIAVKADVADVKMVQKESNLELNKNAVRGPVVDGKIEELSRRVNILEAKIEATRAR